MRALQEADRFPVSQMLEVRPFMTNCCIICCSCFRCIQCCCWCCIHCCGCWCCIQYCCCWCWLLFFRVCVSFLLPEKGIQNCCHMFICIYALNFILFVCLCLFVSVCLSLGSSSALPACLFVCLSPCLFVAFFVGFFVFLHLCFSVCLFVFLFACFIVCLARCWSACALVCPCLSPLSVFSLRLPPPVFSFSCIMFVSITVAASLVFLLSCRCGLLRCTDGRAIFSISDSGLHLLLIRLSAVAAPAGLLIRKGELLHAFSKQPQQQQL